MRASAPPSPLSAAARGMGLAFLAAAFFASANVVIRLADPHMTVWHMMVGRSLFGVLVMSILARSMGIPLLGVHRGMLLAVGLAGVAGVTSLIGALILLPLFEALVLLYLYPAFAAVISPWLTGDRVTARDWGFIALAVLGTAIVLWPERLEGRLQWGHLLALTAALAYAMSFTLTRRVSGANSPLTPFFYISAVGGIACIGPLLWQPGSIWPAAEGWPALAGLAVLATLGHLATNKALSYLPSPRVGVISMFEVVFSGVLGWLLFGEAFGARPLLGGALILASGICLNTARRRPAPAVRPS